METAHLSLALPQADCMQRKYDSSSLEQEAGKNETQQEKRSQKLWKAKLKYRRTLGSGDQPAVLSSRLLTSKAALVHSYSASVDVSHPVRQNSCPPRFLQGCPSLISHVCTPTAPSQGCPGSAGPFLLPQFLSHGSRLSLQHLITQESADLFL